jgi:hypothetical protein
VDKSSWDSISKTTRPKKVRGVLSDTVPIQQAWSPEFKLQYHQKWKEKQ